MNRNPNTRGGASTGYKSYGDIGEEKKQTYHENDDHLQLTSASQFEQFLRASKSNVAILYVYARWCGPCKVIGPEFTVKANGWNPVGIACLKLDGESPVSSEVGIRPIVEGFPTFLIFRNGSYVDKVVGGDWKKLEGMIAKYKS
jgi:thiol-disulfide isomerase/thioredoxin